MRVVYIFMVIGAVWAGCASSSNNSDKYESYPNLVETQSPQNQSHELSKVYIDSVEQIRWNQQPALLIYGTFPDGCTKIGNVSHYISADSLSIRFSAWRNTDIMCTQALTPFSFIYDNLTEEQISSHSHLIINGSTFKY